MISRIVLCLFVLIALPALLSAAGVAPLLKDIVKFSDLGSDFNGNTNKVRVVTLLSPT